MKHRLRRGLLRLVAMFRKPSLDAEFDAELASHLQMAEDELVAQGMEPAAARRQARLQLGGLGAVREHHRDVRGLPFLDVLGQDLRHAFRTLRRDRGFTVVATLVLALSIGATATIFSVVDGVLLQPLPFEQPDRLAWITNLSEDTQYGLSGVTTQAPVFEAWRERSRSFDAMSGYFAFFGSSELTHGERATRHVSVLVLRDLFEVLGAEPWMGRSFTAEEAQQGGPPAVILSHRLWQQRFGADSQILGRAVIVEGEAVTVVGVLPEAFDFGSIFTPGVQADLFRPVSLERIASWGNTLAVVGRLRPQLSATQAHAELASVTAQLKLDRPDLGATYESHVMALTTRTTGSARRGLLILLAAVGAVLAVASANIAGLQLARAANRRKEFAVRAALGAGRMRLLRQLITEGMVLALGSAALGLTLAYSAVGAITRLPGTSLPLLSRVQLDGTTLIFVTLVTVFVGVVCGLTPIIQASLLNLRGALQETNRGSSDGGWQKQARSLLVTAETALACMLLIAALLLVRSFTRVLDVDLGFTPSHALTLTVEPGAELETTAARLAWLDRLRTGLEGLPEVESIGFTDALPLSGVRSWGTYIPGQVYEDGGSPTAFVSLVDHQAMDALGIDLLRGRLMTRDEANQSADVVLVNDTLARSFWPQDEALGKVIVVGLEERQIIGVVADVRQRGAEAEAGLDVYIPIGHDDTRDEVALVIRTRVPADVAKQPILKALRQVDPMLPVEGLRPLSWAVEQTIFARRFVMSLLTGFAAFALLLASMGIYGVIAYTTGRRSQEIGIRMALGATVGDVIRRVLRDTALLAGCGIMAGALGGVFLGRAMRSLLFEVSPNDPVAFAVMALAMIGVSFAAALGPARRAARTDPGKALRP